MTTGKFKIEKNIPLNQVTNLKISEAQAKFPYTRMNVKDSFRFDRKIARSVGFTSKYFGKANGMTFVTKYNGTEGRCWRTK